MSKCYHFYVIILPGTYFVLLFFYRFDVIIYCYHLTFFSFSSKRDTLIQLTHCYVFFSKQSRAKNTRKTCHQFLGWPQRMDGWTTLPMIFFPHLHSNVHTNEGFQGCIRTPEPCTGRVATTKYLYTTVSVPSSELGPPTPSPASDCVEPKGGHTRLRVRGRGSQF